MTTTTLTLKANDRVVCPHCGAVSDDVVADYVIPCAIGPSSRCREECDACHGEIDVEFDGSAYLVSGL